ncbi:hypothetical protein G7Y89_g5201 [Cudoniella acicularis]|uniref:GH16 domain-containing protein n=1 Tax=Cudoniella acicularis TaxID=354080 RepID=A0A8H4RPZ8_9HELO|nr:hypothetical protein G7Y89_g5201 [Cudoniella acicularis]
MGGRLEHPSPVPKRKNSTDSSRDYTTYLTLSTTRLQSSQQAGEVYYKPTNLSHASIRVLARVSGAPGAVAGIFTYCNDTTESDIEILSRDPATSIHYSNQPTTTGSGATVPGSTWNASMPSGASWTSWNVHRLDWIPGRSAWYVNGVQMAITTVNVPRTPSAFILNMWGNGNAWSGVMDVGAGAELQIQWVEMAFNVSGQAATTSASNSNAVVCSVDKVVGTPMAAEGAVTIWAYGTSLMWLSLWLTTCMSLPNA